MSTGAHRQATGNLQKLLPDLVLSTGSGGCLAQPDTAYPCRDTQEQVPKPSPSCACMRQWAMGDAVAQLRSPSLGGGLDLILSSGFPPLNHSLAYL